MVLRHEPGRLRQRRPQVKRPLAAWKEALQGFCDCLTIDQNLVALLQAHPLHVHQHQRSHLDIASLPQDFDGLDAVKPQHHARSVKHL